jgi:Tfp pilus assembly protein PilX
MNNHSHNQQGFVLYFVIVVTSILVTVAVGASVIVSLQLKMTRNIENSLVALSAADTGAEKAFHFILEHLESRQEIPAITLTENLEIGSQFEAHVQCPQDTLLPDICQNIISADCDAENFCIESLGIFQGTRRAIEVQF